MGRNKWSVGRTVAVGAAAMFVAACGSSGNGSDTSGGSADTTSPPATVAPVTSSSTPVGASSSTAQEVSGPDVTRPCSFLTAAEVSTAIHATATMQDDGFRCKYNVGDGWLQVELMEFASGSAQQIFTYDKAHGAPAAGVGDEAYIFGAAIAVKLGDVFIAVDGNNLPQPASDDALTTLANKIVSRIP